MPYRSNRRGRARAAQVKTWSALPDTVFSDLGLSRATLASFADGILGTVVLPGESNYDASLRASFQTTPHKPKIIVYCEVEADIGRCLDWARRHDWWVVPRSGGHSTAGYSVNDSMVIDLSRMNAVYVDPGARTATVSAGTTFATLNAVLNSYKLHVPGGICEDVAIAGYMQGGGYGYTSRAFGMNCDNAVAFRMMLRDGRTVVATPAQNADLFWAVRGGTGNNFGILVDVTYRLHPLWQVWNFGLAWRADDTARVLAALQAGYMRSGASRKLGYMAFIAHRPEYDGQAMLMIRGMYAGDAEDGRTELASLLAIGDPVIEVDTVQPYYQGVKALDVDDLLSLPWGESIKEDKQAGYIDRALSPDDWQKVVDYYVETSPKSYNIVCIEPYGGAINTVGPDSCAFAHRNVDMDFFVDSFWIDDADEQKARDWLDGFMDLMNPFFNGQVYQNYPRRTLTDTARRYFGGNVDRLLAVKDKYDPAPRMFYFEQGLATSRDAQVGGDSAARDFTIEPIVYEPHNDVPGDASGV